DLLRVLDLPAERAREIALEERLELDKQWELLVPAHTLLHQVARDRDALSERNAHALTSRGRRKWTASVVVVRSSNSMGPSAASAATMRSTSSSGADAPAVSPTVVAPPSHATSTSRSSSTKYARAPSL